MLDTRYLMLGIWQCTCNEIPQHPASRNQYPGLTYKANDFHRDSLRPMRYFMQL
jgi:hypothetical protein